MSGYPTPVGLALMINALTGQGVAAQTVYLGTARSLPTSEAPTLANIDESDESGYARAAVTFAAAVINADETVDALNSAESNLGTVATDMIPAGYAFLTTAATGNVLSAPVITTPLAAPTASGGTFSAGTYYWVVTAVNSRGETVASNEVSATLALNDSQALAWGAVSGATAYRVYRGTATGGENALITETASTSYTDTGTAGTAATPPTVNSASVGDLLYVWELAEPVAALASTPVIAPTGGLIIE